MEVKITAPFECMLKDNPELVSHLRRKYKNDFVVMDKKVFHYDIGGETIFARDHILKTKIQVRDMKKKYMSADRAEANSAVESMLETIFEEVLEMSRHSSEERIFLLSFSVGDIVPNKDTLHPEMSVIVKGLI